MLHSMRRKIRKKERDREGRQGGREFDRDERERKFHDRSWSIAEIAGKWESAAHDVPIALGPKKSRPSDRRSSIWKKKTGQKALAANGVDKTHQTLRHFIPFFYQM